MILCLLLWANTASAADKAGKTGLAKTEQKLQFEVYAGGIDAVTAAMSIKQDKSRYAVSINAETRGLLGKIVPWSGTFDTRGWVTHGGMRPELHESSAISGKDTEYKTYHYGQDGSFKSYRVTTNGKDETPKDLDRGLTQGTTDALTAALAVMASVAEDGQCEGSNEIFDGDRRFRLVFHDRGSEILAPSDYSLYTGPAERCEAEVIPMTGRWSAKPRGWLSIQEQGRKAGSLPMVWMAKLEKGGPAVPVRMRVKTDYGTLFMHVIGYSNDQGVAQGKKVEMKESTTETLHDG